MIYLLCITLGLLTFIIYYTNKNFLSISFISSVSLLVSSSVYCILYNEIGQDISFKTFLVVVFSIFFLFFGEKSFNIISQKDIQSNSNVVSRDNSVPYYYYSSKRKMIIVFFFMCLIFIVRFYDLYKFSLSLGNNSGILGTLSSVRLAYATGQYTPSTFLPNIALYVTLCFEFYAYTYLYYFLYNLLIVNVRLYRLLLPLCGYLIILISTTGRNQYIFIVCVLITMVISIYSKKEDKIFKYNKVIFKRVVKIAIFSIIALIVYASISRNADEYTSSNIYQVLTSYFSAPIYGLDVSMDKQFYGINGGELTFGYYTLQNIHSFLNNFGYNFPTPVFHNLPFFYYKNGGSNIYTTLLFPIFDYGIIGMLISRFFIGVIYSISKNIFFQSIQSKKDNISLVVFFSIFIYCAINSYIADRYYDYFLDINTLIKYTVFSYILIRFYKWKTKKILLVPSLERSKN